MGTTGGDFELIANVSLLYSELPLLDRFRAAADSGFAATELWWPFNGPTPAAGEVGSLITAVAESGIPLAGMNLWAGDMAAGERGVLSQPARTADFARSLEVTAHVALETGCRVFNALYGQLLDSESPADQGRSALENLSRAAEVLGRDGGVVLLEPLSAGLNGAYPILTIADALPIVRAVRERTGTDSIALLFDTFHLTNNGDDLLAGVLSAAGLIGHVQLADSPGRGEPGTGGIDFASVLDALWDSGYRGAVACEYAPTVPTAASLGWIDRMPHLALLR